MIKLKKHIKNYLKEVNDNGFSLLELVVAVGILLVLTGGGLLAYSGITENARKAAVQAAAAEVYTGAVAYDSNGDDYRQAADEWNETSKKGDNNSITVRFGDGEETNGDGICVVAEMTNHGITAYKGSGCEFEGVVSPGGNGGNTNPGGSDNEDNSSNPGDSGDGGNANPGDETGEDTPPIIGGDGSDNDGDNSGGANPDGSIQIDSAGRKTAVVVNSASGLKSTITVNWSNYTDTTCTTETQFWITSDGVQPVGARMRLIWNSDQYTDSSSWSADTDAQTVTEDAYTWNILNKPSTSDNTWFSETWETPQGQMKGETNRAQFQYILPQGYHFTDEHSDFGGTIYDWGGSREQDRDDRWWSAPVNFGEPERCNVPSEGSQDYGVDGGWMSMWSSSSVDFDMTFFMKKSLPVGTRLEIPSFLRHYGNEMEVAGTGGNVRETYEVISDDGETVVYEVVETGDGPSVFGWYGHNAHDILDTSGYSDQYWVQNPASEADIAEFNKGNFWVEFTLPEGSVFENGTRTMRLGIEESVDMSKPFDYDLITGLPWE